MDSGNILKNDELSLGEIINEIDKTTKQIKILVTKTDADNSNLFFEKSKEIVCPECKESAFIYFKNYKISFKCKNEHELKDYLFEQYEKSQKIDISKIICEQCKKNKKSNTYNQIFYRCNTCKMNLCPLCKLNHNKSHKIINYENKNFICPIHNENFSLYCKSCKQNICIFCENEHTKHETISFGKIITNIEDLRAKYQNLNDNINKFKQNVDELINILNRTVNIFEIYSNIINDAINNYKNKNINYHVLYNIKGIFNHFIIEDLDKIINEQNSINKFSIIVNIYNNIANKKIIHKNKTIANNPSGNPTSNQKSLYNNLFGEATSKQNTLYKSLFGDTTSKRKISANNPTSNQNTSPNNPTTNQEAQSNNISNNLPSNQNIPTNNISDSEKVQETLTNNTSDNLFSKQKTPSNNIFDSQRKISTNNTSSKQETLKNNLYGNPPSNQKFSIEALFGDTSN